MFSAACGAISARRCFPPLLRRPPGWSPQRRAAGAPPRKTNIEQFSGYGKQIFFTARADSLPLPRRRRGTGSLGLVWALMTGEAAAGVAKRASRRPPSVLPGCKKRRSATAPCCRLSRCWRRQAAREWSRQYWSRPGEGCLAPASNRRRHPGYWSCCSTRPCSTAGKAENLRRARVMRARGGRLTARSKSMTVRLVSNGEFSAGRGCDDLSRAETGPSFAKPRLEKGSER